MKPTRSVISIIKRVFLSLSGLIAAGIAVAIWTVPSAFYGSYGIDLGGDVNLINELKERGISPRVHGNGFIQVDLTHDTRLHVWGDKRIPRQNTYTPIHDHVFGFKSHLVVKSSGFSSSRLIRCRIAF